MFFKVENLCFGYHKQPLCLKDVSFSLEKGDKFFCLAEKDNGKTTFLKLVSNFETHYFGKVLINGENLKAIDDGAKGFSLLLGEPVLFERKTVKANLDFFCKACNLPPVCATEADVWLKNNGIKARAGDKIKNLPVLEKRKFAIFRSLLKNPSIIFLDDQFDGLNELEAEAMKQIYKNLFENKNLTIISTLGPEPALFLQNEEWFLKSKMAYLSLANFSVYKNFENFKNCRPNLDAIKFLRGVSLLDVSVALENGDYRLVLENGSAASFDDIGSQSLASLKMEDFEICQCAAASFCEKWPASAAQVLKLIKNGSANLYFKLTGEKLL